MSGTPFSSESLPPYDHSTDMMLLTWSDSCPSEKAIVKVRGGFWIFGPSSISLSQVSKNLPLLTGPTSSIRQWGGQTSIAYGAPITTPSLAVADQMPMSYMPPALVLFRLTSSPRSPTSPRLYQ
jgi:hypothetical protein